ncbi:asparaginase domain-containing protein [Pelagerythrobacter aerophilus]|uniref:Asparaginase n=1 Tax=Pelagerythrobacter aerophilus TaxID=2306995 RepID=A0A418NLC8_9SPHN|nr:asparaginase domain-containing protein [Pelagerythrobacter aerophilus]RIV80316.1 asparaginase [Pelagerythrobacter aerophilus]
MGSEPILVLTTGGTIDKKYFDALSEYQVRESLLGDLFHVAQVRHPYRMEEVLRKDSLELTDDDRTLIGAKVQAAQETRILVTHGTDTMTSTARMLAEVPGKTIVLVGSLAPAILSKSDAAFNLGMAFACCQLAKPGIYITMNGTVFDGLLVQTGAA